MRNPHARTRVADLTRFTQHVQQPKALLNEFVDSQALLVPSPFP